jgi:hypothetical protein
MREVRYPFDADWSSIESTTDIVCFLITGIVRDALDLSWYPPSYTLYTTWQFVRSCQVPMNAYFYPILFCLLWLWILWQICTQLLVGVLQIRQHINTCNILRRRQSSTWRIARIWVSNFNIAVNALVLATIDLTFMLPKYYDAVGCCKCNDLRLKCWNIWSILKWSFDDKGYLATA